MPTIKDSANEIWDELKELYSNGEKGGTFYWNNMSSAERQKISAATDYLKDKGLIRTAPAIGFVQVELTSAGIDLIESPAPHDNEKESTFISINNVNGPSIIGSQQNATINAGASLEEIQSIVNKAPAEDQAILQELVVTLKDMEAGKIEPKKGALAKFSDMLHKHETLITAIGGWLAKYIIG